MQKITNCLWFDTQAEEAVNFYVSVFKNSKIGEISRYGEVSSEAARRPKGSVMTIMFELDGQKFMALNGGPNFKFTEAISLMVNCDDQDELDRMWYQLSSGGEESQCGWLKDKFGLSWQIVPSILEELISGDAEKSERVMAEVVKMQKLDIETLKRAANAG